MSHASNQRAKALLKLVEKLGQQLPTDLSSEDRNKQAMDSLDKQLGEQWRTEIEASDFELPAAEGKSDGSMEEGQGIDCMYEKVKALLDANGESPSLIQNTGTDERRPKKQKSARIIILG